MSIADLIAALNGLAPEAVWAIFLVVCFGAILALQAFFGAAGLYAFIVIGIIGANIQVLKSVQFGVLPDPVGLGTILFASTYLATDILNEHYGPQAARRAVWLGFAGLLTWVVLMLLTLGFRPLTPEQAGDALAWSLPVHDAMVTLFQPAPMFFVAGMIAYLTSQFHDVWLYALLRRRTNQRYLWLRNNLSTWISALIDNIIFSLLAWIILPMLLGEQALPLLTVIYTYILGTYVLRIIVAALDTPFIYLSTMLAHRDQDRDGARGAAPA